MSCFLIEPYNAYSKNPKPKHWMIIAEEEALYFRTMLTEQQLLLNSDKPVPPPAPGGAPYIASNIQTMRITEDGNIRITEDGNIRILEG